MGIFDWLIGGKAKAPASRRRSVKPSPPKSGPAKLARGRAVDQTKSVYRIDGDFLHIPSRDFFGFFRRSPDGRYILSWLEAPSRGDGKKELGRYFLLENGRIAAEGRVERPNDGKVADNGTFIINDWHFFSSELVGTFRAYRADGRSIIARRFSANLFNNGLSPDGRYAVCQTCNSSTEDSGKLTVFDLEAGREVGSMLPESGWAQSYEFPPDGQTVRLTYREGGSYAYSLQGEFLDRERWIGESLARGDLHLVNRLIQDASGKPSPVVARRLLSGVEKGLNADYAKDPRTRASGLKLRGICFEAVDAKSDALAAYEEALRLDPKVGVKRRAADLRKQLSAE